MAICLCCLAWPAGASDPTISGVVRDASTGDPVEGINVTVFTSAGASAATVSDANGEYQVNAPPGATAVLAVVRDERPTAIYAGQSYPGISTGELGTPQQIELSGEDVTGIDFDLVPGFLIAGTTIDSQWNPVEAGPYFFRQEGPQSIQTGGLFNPEGEFTSERLVPNEYRVGVRTFDSSFAKPDRHIDMLYDDVVCVQGGCDVLDLGTPVTLTDSDINLGSIVMPDGVVFKGTVTDAATEASVPDGSVSVSILAEDGETVASASVINGQYATPALPSGTYKVFFNPQSSFLSQYFGDSAPCTPTCNPAVNGAEITLDGSSDFTADIALQQGFAISGRVFDQADATVAVTTFCRELYTAAGEFVIGQCGSDEAGEFVIDGLPADNYKLVIEPYAESSDFLETLYDGFICGTGSCPVADQGTIIELVDQDVHLEIPLTRGGVLRGSMVDDASGANIDGTIELLMSSGDFGPGAFNVVDGEIEINGLLPGTYKAAFRADGFVDQLYNGVACPNFSCDRAELGEIFEVFAGDTTNLDPVRMAPAAVIEGTITGSDGAVIDQASMQLFDALGNFVAAQRVDEQGVYRLDNLPAAPDGGYRLKAVPDAGYLEQLFDGRDCAAFCPPADGDPIELEAGENITIDMTLQRASSIIVNAFDRDAPELPIVTACVDVLTVEGQFVNGRCFENADGVFEVPGLLPGDYKVLLNPYGDSSRYVLTLYDGISCFPGCDFASQGTVVSLGESDLELSLGVEAFNLLSGVITDTEGNPVQNVRVRARPTADPDQQLFLSGTFAEDGSYELRIPDGEFYIDVEPFGDSSNYLRQIYPGIPCTFQGCAVEQGTSFSFQGNDLVLNPQLQLGARVSGSIARADDGVVSSANVALSTRARDASTGLIVSGSYGFSGLLPGEYWLGVRSLDTDPVLIDQLYEAKPCPGLDCDFEEVGDVLILEAGDDLQIDFALELAPTQTVTGAVLERNSDLPLAGAKVDVFGNDFFVPFRTVETDPNGEFSVELPAGNYALIIEQDGYITRAVGSFLAPAQGWCSARRCLDFPGQRFDVADQPVDLGELPMDPGALLTGTLSLPEGDPVGSNLNARLRVFDELGQTINGLQTQIVPLFGQDAPGTFAVEVPPGRWHLLFETVNPDRSLVATALGDLPCPGGSCGMETTASVEVAQGDVVTHIDSSQLAVTMNEGVPLTGSLVDGDNGDIGLEIGSVYFYNDEGRFAGGASVNPQGNFQTLGGFPDGIFYASTRFISSQGFSGTGVAAEFVDVLYDGFPCISTCDVTSGTPIEVDLQAAALPPPITITLTRGASISGSVRAADTAAPVNAQIEVFDAEGRSVPGASTSLQDGSFTVGGLLPGDYFVRTRNFAGLEDQLWNGDAPILCAPSCSPLNGTAISVSSGGSVDDVDFELAGAGSISGTTTGSDSQPLEAITVEVYNALGGLVGSALSDENGAWTVDSLPAGRFYVRSRNSLGLVNVAWEGLECTGCDVTQTNAIDLDRGQAVPDIDLIMDTGATLSGTVSRQADASPVAGVNVDVYNAAGVLLASAQTGSSGTWQVGGLGAGSYRVATRSSLGLVNQVHSGVDCAAGCDIAAGTLVLLDIGQTETIDFALEPSATIAGTVRDANGSPLADVAVQAFLADGRFVREGRTSASGSYEIRGLAPGDMFLRTRADGNYTDQTYSRRDCIPICDVAGSDPVQLGAGQRVEEIDFSLTFGSGVTGRVTRLDQSPVSSLSVEIYNAVGSLVGNPRTDASGQFTLRGLPGGRYFARTRNTRGFIDQLFDGFTCTPSPCVTGLGTSLELAGGLVEDVDFILDAGNELLGTVTDQFGNPLPTGEVVLYDDTGREVKRGDIDDGEWRLTGIADGTYFAVVLNGSGLIDELFERRPCPGGRCEVTQGTPIVLPLPDPAAQSLTLQNVAGRSQRTAGDGPLAFELQSGSRIRGVLQTPDETPLTNAKVFFFNDQGEVIGSAQTDGLGEFRSQAAFSEGSYFIATTDGETRGVTTGGYVNVVYDQSGSLACPLECDVSQGTAIELDGQFDSDPIVVQLLDGGSLSGRAVDGADSGLSGAEIEIYDSQGRLSGTATVGTSGTWRVDGLPDGGYRVVMRNDLLRPLADLVVGDGFCGSVCDPSAGRVFNISDGEPEAEVDIVLSREDVIFQSRFQAD